MNRESIFIRNANSALLTLEPYVAGPTLEDIMRTPRTTHEQIIKLSSNENPLGPSPKAIETIQKAAPRVSLYPSAKCERLRKAIASALGQGLMTDNILVAAGSSEIFSFIIRAFSKPSDKILFGNPSFSVYGDAAIVDGRVPVPISLEEPLFDITCSDIENQYGGTARILFITRPNNPTSRLVPLGEVRKICKLAKDAIVVCDEAYIEFAEDYRNVTAINLLSEFGNLLVTRTFSKAYGLSDLRVGYAVGPSEAIEVLFKIRPKWNNGELSQEAAIAALSDTEHLKKTLATVREGRRFLSSHLSEMGFEVTADPQGNFVFASPSPLGVRAEYLLKELMTRGIAVRGPPADWKLNYLRISVGMEVQNEKVVTAIRDLVHR